MKKKLAKLLVFVLVKYETLLVLLLVSLLLAKLLWMSDDTSQNLSDSPLALSVVMLLLVLLVMKRRITGVVGTQKFGRANRLPTKLRRWLKLRLRLKLVLVLMLKLLRLPVL